MYNDEIKREFLANSSGQKLVSSAFNRAEKYEKKFGKDLCQFNRAEIIEFLNNFESVEASTYITMLPRIRAYVKWCMNLDQFVCSEYGVSDAIFDISVKRDIDFIAPIRNALYQSFDEVLEEFGPGFDFYNGDVAAPAACLAWLGFDSKEMIQLKDSNVDLVQREIRGDDGSIIAEDLPREMCEILAAYREADSVIQVQHWDTTFYKLKSEFFLQKLVTSNSKKEPKPVEIRQLQRKLEEVSTAYEKRTGKKSKLKIINIQRSGDLHRLYELEKSGVNIYAARNEDIVKKTYGRSGKQFYDITFTYKCYKEAFNLI